MDHLFVWRTQSVEPVTTMIRWVYGAKTLRTMEKGGWYDTVVMTTLMASRAHGKLAVGLARKSERLQQHRTVVNGIALASGQWRFAIKRTFARITLLCHLNNPIDRPTPTVFATLLSIPENH